MGSMGSMGGKGRGEEGGPRMSIVFLVPDLEFFERHVSTRKDEEGKVPLGETLVVVTGGGWWWFSWL